MHPFPTDHPECTAFRRSVAEALDEPATDTTHASACGDCRRYATAAKLLDDLTHAPKPEPSAGFTNRVVVAALRERRTRTYRRAGVGLAVAAGLVAAVVSARPQAGPPPAQAGPEFAEVQPAVRVETRLADAGTALLAMTRRTADETVGPARSLMPTFDAPNFPPTVPPEAGSAVEALAEMPQAARAGFEPVTNSARRAVALFLRDTGLSDSTH
jgi:hypothetical protein